MQKKIKRRPFGCSLSDEVADRIRQEAKETDTQINEIIESVFSERYGIGDAYASFNPRAIDWRDREKRGAETT